MGGPYSLREQLETIGQQKVLLEWQLEEANRTQIALEQQLVEERTRGAESREKLALLAARIEQLENDRERTPPQCVGLGGSGAAVVDGRELYSELEAQRRELEDLRWQVQAAARLPQTPCTVAEATTRDSAGPKSATGSLRAENEQLRMDLQESREMLARYTEELAAMVPGVQQILADSQRQAGKMASMSRVSSTAALPSATTACGTGGRPAPPRRVLSPQQGRSGGGGGSRGAPPLVTQQVCGGSTCSAHRVRSPTSATCSAQAVGGRTAFGTTRNGAVCRQIVPRTSLRGGAGSGGTA